MRLLENCYLKLKPGVSAGPWLVMREEGRMWWWARRSVVGTEREARPCKWSGRGIKTERAWRRFYALSPGYWHVVCSLDHFAALSAGFS